MLAVKLLSLSECIFSTISNYGMMCSSNALNYIRNSVPQERNVFNPVSEMVYNNQELFKTTNFVSQYKLPECFGRVTTQGFYLQLVSVSGLACSFFNKWDIPLILV
jgi:hypothetical protein